MSDQNKDEQTFSIQPHPATTNDPSTDPAFGAPSGNSATGSREPHIPSQAVAEGLEKPKSREELQSLQKSLNE